MGGIFRSICKWGWAWFLGNSYFEALFSLGILIERIIKNAGLSLSFCDHGTIKTSQAEALKEALENY